MSRVQTPIHTSDGAPAREQVSLPDERTIAFAVSVVRSKPPELSIEEYIKLLRQHIAKGRRENALSTVYSHLDRSAYWRAEADRVKAGLKAAEKETIGLRQEVAVLKSKLDNRPSSPTKKRKKPDEDIILVPRSPKKSKRAGSPERIVQPPLDHVTDVEFSQAGEIGNTLLRSVFNILAAFKSTQRTKPVELLHHIVRASSTVPQIVQSEVEKIVTEQASDNEQLKTALTVSHRTIATILAGFTRLGHVHDTAEGAAAQGKAVYAIVSMFRNLLVDLPLLSAEEVDKVITDEASIADMRPATARPSSPIKSKGSTARPSTARPSTAGLTGPKKSKIKAKSRGLQKKDTEVKENATLSLYAGFLGKLVDMIDPKVEANQALFEGFAYCILDRLGKRLYHVVFGHDRAGDLEAEIKQNIDSQEQHDASAPGITQPEDDEEKQIKLEAPYLLHLLNRVMAAAPAHMGNINGVKNSKTKYSSKTLSKNTLAVSAKECLQRTLINGMFGHAEDEAEDPFKECLRMPIAGDGVLAMPKVTEVDVLEHFKAEVWRCLGWEILAKEGEWNF
ncbi:hypothetical protein Slin14017_G118620 [Septoria linicola]|nr:hypothetical protein Slin14017_G118620 [Septoria linicola]